eukprot:TRINITY_DN15613_c0_g1_i2.p1 TRINITY_DN15613_c0_g1~~TRINITY_DN15613_c0_g1_i2.p1  ORF type:complete len:317 (+),score=87.22 TRINITY_DN15613_c0_g1_i2:209-1159(+)
MTKFTPLGRTGTGAALSRFGQATSVVSKGTQGQVVRSMDTAFGSVSKRSYNSYNSGGGSQLTPAEKKKWMWLAASGATGVGIVCLSGLAQSSDGHNSFAPYVRSRLSKTYAYLAGGLGMTAASAFYLNQAGFTRVLMTTNPWIVMGGTMLATISTMMATRMIDQERVLMKHTAWSLFNVAVGASLAPIAMIGGPIVLKAAAITGCIVGSISLVAASAPSEQFLWMGGPLTLGLGVVVASSVGSMFFPASPLLYNISMYGGLGLFGGFVLFDTGKVINHAERNAGFDPINECMGIYMNTINIFTRIVYLLAGNNRRR